MDELKNEDLAIDLRIMKLCFFYHFVNPNIKTRFGCNVYRLFYILINVIAQCFIFYGMFGYFSIMNELDEINFVLTIIPLLYNYYYILRLCVLLYKQKTIWDVVEVSRFNFFTSKMCCKNVKILRENAKITATINIFYYYFSLVTGVQWIIVPLLLNLFKTLNTSDNRMQNILNLPFPVTTCTYNQYYIVFYLIEMIISSCLLSTLLMDIYALVSFNRVIIGQYKVIAHAFEDIGVEKLLTQIRKTFINITFKLD